MIIIDGILYAERHEKEMKSCRLTIVRAILLTILMSFRQFVDNCDYGIITIWVYLPEIKSFAVVGLVKTEGEEEVFYDNPEGRHLSGRMETRRWFINQKCKGLP